MRRAPGSASVAIPAANVDVLVAPYCLEATPDMLMKLFDIVHAYTKTVRHQLTEADRCRAADHCSSQRSGGVFRSFRRGESGGSPCQGRGTPSCLLRRLSHVSSRGRCALEM